MVDAVHIALLGQHGVTIWRDQDRPKWMPTQIYGAARDVNGTPHMADHVLWIHGLLSGFASRGVPRRWYGSQWR